VKLSFGGFEVKKHPLESRAARGFETVYGLPTGSESTSSSRLGKDCLERDPTGSKMVRKDAGLGLTQRANSVVFSTGVDCLDSRFWQKRRY
jgi:hypothetical protein